MVNTFLPYPSFDQSLRCLDKKRLHKQIVEAYQIYNVLQEMVKLAKLIKIDLPTNPNEYYVWIRKLARACKDKRPYYFCYDKNRSIQITIDENASKRIKYGWWYHPATLMWFNSTEALAAYYTQAQHIYFEYYSKYIQFEFQIPYISTYTLPEWFGQREFHSAMCAMLYSKDSLHYSQFEADAEFYQDYIWPRKPT